MSKSSILATAITVVLIISIFNCVRYKLIVNANNSGKDLKTATVKELSELPSIGETKAEKIIQASQYIENIDELKDIKSIGETNVDVLIDAGYICK